MRKKKQEPVVIVHEPEALYLDKMDMMKLQLKEAQVSQLLAQIDKFKFQEQLTLIEQRAVLGSLRGQRKSVETQYEKFMDGYKVLRAEIEKKLGIDLDQYGVMDDGRLTLLPDAIPKEKTG